MSVFPTQDDWYMGLLSDQRVGLLSGNHIFYSYDVTRHSFAARLTNQEVEKITKMQGIIGVYKDKNMKFHTTRSPDCLGLNVNYGLWPYTNFGENVIIGLVDTGIRPESKSLNDRGLGLIPSGWKVLREEGTELNPRYELDLFSPAVASFSSRESNSIIPEILKPDLLAPGINILAAFVPNVAPTGSPYDPRRVNLNIMSATSMACPHVAGATALLHAAYPNWSPAAIRSALMTTSAIINNENRSIARYEDMEPATALGIGAGHISPQSAADPGLIYGANVSDHINLLCSLNYTKEQLKLFVVRLNPCSNPAGSPGDLNYPSFSVVFRPDNYVQELKRTVTNVGELLPEMYHVRIVNPCPDKVIITVKP
ncbi:hypothetical protein F0562_006511 [Nyssa sinensis]|uniref:Peptidase S8/S53 domain-containing protein n=1 Tax=Nyssa sinensis TaxID=561372 RepID=A0A5J5APT8_9ASTE|nr:hypothetical protein F0562_006511 [Nyssa sinensis]